MIIQFYTDGYFDCGCVVLFQIKKYMKLCNEMIFYLICVMLNVESLKSASIQLKYISNSS